MDDMEQQARLQAIQELLSGSIGPAMDARIRSAMPAAEEAPPMQGEPDGDESSELAELAQLLDGAGDQPPPDQDEEDEEP